MTKQGDNGVMLPIDAKHVDMSDQKKNRFASEMRLLNCLYNLIYYHFFSSSPL